MKYMIVLEEQTEARGLTHIVSEHAFRYPNPSTGDLYLVGKDEMNLIHFLIVEQTDDDVMLRVIEDPVLFDVLLDFSNNSNCPPISEADEQLRRKIGIPTQEGSERQTVAKLTVMRM